MQKKKGISLIVLVITIISTYDETVKIDKNPPKNKITAMINIAKVTELIPVTFNFCKNIV